MIRLVFDEGGRHLVSWSEEYQHHQHGGERNGVDQGGARQSSEADEHPAKWTTPHVDHLAADLS